MGVIVRQGIKASAVQYAGMLLAYLNVLFIFPLVFSREETGLFRMIVETAMVLSTIGLVATNYAMTRFFSRFYNDETNESHGFYFWSYALSSIGLILLICFLFIFQKPLFGLFKLKSEAFTQHATELILMFIFMSFNMITDTIAAIFGRVVVPTLLREVFLRVFQTVLTVLYYYRIIDLNQLISLLPLSYAISFVINLIYVIKLTGLNLKPDFQFIKENPDLRKEYFSFVSFFFLTILGSALFLKMDFWALSSKQGLEQTGVYSLAFYLALLIEVPKRVIGQMADPILASHIQKNEREEMVSLYSKTYFSQQIVGLFLFAAICLNIHFIFQLIPNGKFYEEGKWVVMVIGLAKWLELSIGNSVTLFTYSKYFWFTAVFNFGMMITSLIFNLLWTETYGILGAGSAQCMSMFCGIVLQLIGLKIWFDVNPWNKMTLWLNLPSLILLSVLMFIPEWGNIWISGPLKTIVFLVFFLTHVYKTKYLPEFNQILIKIPSNIKKGNYKIWE